MPALLSSTAWRRATAAGLLLASLLVPCLTAASDAPDRGAPPATPSLLGADRVPDIVIPALPQALKVRQDVNRPIGVLVARQVTADGTLHRGGAYTDGAEGLPAAPPNLIEIAKLEAARKAVETSRLAGTLAVPAPERELTPLERERISEAKMQRLLEARPIELSPFPPAGVGPGFVPVQLQGPAGPSAGEQAKRAAELRGEAPPAAPIPARAPAPPQDRKEDR